MLNLSWLVWWKYGPISMLGPSNAIPFDNGLPRKRELSSRLPCSTLITCAPNSPRVAATRGPDHTQLRHHDLRRCIPVQPPEHANHPKFRDDHLELCIRGQRSHYLDHPIDGYEHRLAGICKQCPHLGEFSRWRPSRRRHCVYRKSWPYAGQCLCQHIWLGGKLE